MRTIEFYSIVGHVTQRLTQNYETLKAFFSLKLSISYNMFSSFVFIFLSSKVFYKFFFIKASNLSSLCVSENVYFSILDFFRNNLYTTNCIHLDVSLYANTRNTPTTVKVQTFPSPPEDYLWPFAVYPYLCPSSRKPHICFMSLSIILQFI